MHHPWVSGSCYQFGGEVGRLVLAFVVLVVITAAYCGPWATDGHLYQGGVNDGERQWV